MSERTVSLILAFLHTKKSKIFSNVQTSRHEGYLPHVDIIFNYTGLDVIVTVYNDNFIKIAVKKEPWTICDGIRSVRDAIHKLEHYNYGYRYC